MKRRYIGKSRGFTLVELMVALVVSLLVAIAAISTLIVSRRGFLAVDAASELRDNARFAADLITRVSVQTGFKDVNFSTQVATAAEQAANTPPDISGFNNAQFNTADITTSTAWGTQAGAGSDVLILRYQAVKKTSNPTDTSTDGSMIDCAGNTITTAPTSRNDREISVFYIDTDASGEPSLMCAYLPTGATTFTATPLVRGVENFQVLYGIDAPAPVANQLFTGTQDSVPHSYMRADQMVVGTTTSSSTYSNWRRVRSIRIGMVLRAAANSDVNSAARTYYPFGIAPSSATGTAGSAFANANDTGTSFSAPADGRLRQVATFTIHLRNDQGL